jgi:hypothetical protein
VQVVGQSRLTKAFGLRSGQAWRRDANPWSVYTRLPSAAVDRQLAVAVRAGRDILVRAQRSADPGAAPLAALVLSAVSAAGVPFWAWALIVLDPWITAFGLAVQMLGKLSFLDRMALLYDQMTT